MSGEPRPTYVTHEEARKAIGTIVQDAAFYTLDRLPAGETNFVNLLNTYIDERERLEHKKLEDWTNEQIKFLQETRSAHMAMIQYIRKRGYSSLVEESAVATNSTGLAYKYLEGLIARERRLQAGLLEAMQGLLRTMSNVLQMDTKLSTCAESEVQSVNKLRNEAIEFLGSAVNVATVAIQKACTQPLEHDEFYTPIVTVPPIVCLCGSMRFAAQFRLEAFRLSLKGYVVVQPAFLETPTPYEKKVLDALTFMKIDMANFVHVIDVSEYIGHSTKREIEYAEGIGKRISYYSGTKGEKL